MHELLFDFLKDSFLPTTQHPNLTLPPSITNLHDNPPGTTNSPSPTQHRVVPWAGKEVTRSEREVEEWPGGASAQAGPDISCAARQRLWPETPRLLAGPCEEAETGH